MSGPALQPATPHPRTDARDDSAERGRARERGVRGVRLYPGPPHRHDAEIERLWRELRALVQERKRDRCRQNCPRLGYRHTETSKAQIGAANRGKPGNKDAKLSPATRAKISAANKAAWERRRQGLTCQRAA